MIFNSEILTFIKITEPFSHSYQKFAIVGQDYWTRITARILISCSLFIFKVFSALSRHSIHA